MPLQFKDKVGRLCTVRGEGVWYGDVRIGSLPKHFKPKTAKEAKRLWEERQLQLTHERSRGATVHNIKDYRRR